MVRGKGKTRGPVGRASGRNRPLRGPLSQSGGTSAGQSTGDRRGRIRLLKDPLLRATSVS